MARTIESKTGRILLILLSIAGMVVMGYLVSVHFSPEEGAFCNLGEGLSCDIVNKSIYAKVLGIPISILGFLYFLLSFSIALFKYERPMLKGLGWLSIVFLGPSLYLTGIELFVLDNICIFCEISKVLIIGIIAVTIIYVRPVKFDSKSLISAILLGVVSAGVLYFIHSRTVPSGQYTEFASCVYEEGWRMYGAKSCSFCAKQRALFGDAFEEIKEIECDPRFEDHQVDRCVAKDISHTPTWILEDEEGNDINRLPSGVVSLEDLSELSGCQLPE